MARVPALDTFVQKADVWLTEIADDMGTADKQEAYHALRNVLHALRDRLIPEEAVHLSAELPTLIRGIYFEGYKLSDVPKKPHSTEAFLDEVRKNMSNTQVENLDVRQATESVFTVLAGHISTGEVEDVIHMFAKNTRDLWPETLVRDVEVQE